MDGSDYQSCDQRWEHFGCVCFRNNDIALPVQPLGSRSIPAPALSVHRILHAQKPSQTTQHKEEMFSSACPCPALWVNKGLCAALVVFMVLALWQLWVRLEPCAVPSPHSGIKILLCASRAGLCCQQGQQKQSEFLAWTFEVQWFLWPMAPWGTEK